MQGGAARLVVGTACALGGLIRSQGKYNDRTAPHYIPQRGDLRVTPMENMTKFVPTGKEKSNEISP
jgi:hypothetical protein